MNGQNDTELTPERKKIAEAIIQKTNASLEEVVEAFKTIDEMYESAMKYLYAPRFVGGDLEPYITTGK